MVHTCVIKSRFSSEIFILNKLIESYGKCNCFNYARKLFDHMPHRNTYTWNAIIYVHLKLTMVDEGIQLFSQIPHPDRCSWNLMISGLVQIDSFEEALTYLVKMHRLGFVPDDYTFGSATNACAKMRNFKAGTQIHACVSKSWPSNSVCLGSALVDMYSKCGLGGSSQQVFDEMLDRNRVTWNSLISCYEQNGPAHKSLEVFNTMMKNELPPDEMTLATVISACASLSAVTQGREIHSYLLKRRRFASDEVISNALVDMYAKCGKIEEARAVFEGIPSSNLISQTSMVRAYAREDLEAARFVFSKMEQRNIVSWNALIAGYTQIGENEEAISLFRLLNHSSISPTHHTFGNLLNACANLADVDLGRQFHPLVLKSGFWFNSNDDSDIFVANSMIDMYMKCGSVNDGGRVFCTMPRRNVVSWNAMITGHAQNGNGETAMEIFEEMVAEGEAPDGITVIGALCACSHAGLVDAGRKVFASMETRFGVRPERDHYACMVDVLCRGGCLGEARELIERMPMGGDGVVWGTLLWGCRVHGDGEMGRYAAGKLEEMGTGVSGTYVAVSNMYAERGRWREVAGVRKMMRRRGVPKEVGCSWIKVNGSSCVFLAKGGSCYTDLFDFLRLLTNQMKWAGVSIF